MFPALKTKLRNFSQRLLEAGGVAGLQEADEELGFEDGLNPVWRVPDRVIAEEADDDSALLAPQALGVRRGEPMLHYAAGA